MEQDKSPEQEDEPTTMVDRYVKYRAAFEKAMVPKGAGDYQRQVMLDCFDAGGQITMMVMTGFARDIPDEEAEAQLQGLHDYFQDIARRMAMAAMKRMLGDALGGGAGIEILSMDEVANGKLEQLLGKG